MSGWLKGLAINAKPARESIISEDWRREIGAVVLDPDDVGHDRVCITYLADRHILEAA